MRGGKVRRGTVKRGKRGRRGEAGGRRGGRGEVGGGRGEGKECGRVPWTHHICQSVVSKCVDLLPSPIDLVGGIMVPEDQALVPSLEEF